MPFNEFGVPSGRQEYEIQDHYHSEITRPIKLICVGSGISGMYLAFSMISKLESYHLTIYEKNKEVGGTWYENRYPGCACDIPAHLYTFSWAPKYDWSMYYAGSAEIQAYCKSFYDQHELSRFTKLEHKVRNAVWNENESNWHVEIEDLSSGQIFTDVCDVLVNATGFLNKWKWPEIKGLDKFQKPKIHSANWDDTVDCNGKVVGVIGTGSSAIQIVPQMQKVAKQLKVFMRSPTWITPAIGGEVSSQFQGEGEDESARRGHEQFTFTEEEKNRFRDDPEYHLRFRRRIEAEINFTIDLFKMGSDMQRDVQEQMTKQMKARIGDGQPELTEKLIPKWPPGCRRLTPGDRYLESLVEKNVEPIFGSIERVDETTIHMTDGTEHELDVLVCATGFDVSFVPSFEIYGRSGKSMREAWRDLPDAYLGLAAPDFPNYFVICGPQGPLGNGSILPAIELICSYIVSICLKMQMEQIKSLEPGRRATTLFQEHLSKYHKNSVWGQPCRSWYKNGKTDGEPQLWCGSVLSYMKTIRNPRYEDYVIKYASSNPWAFLGNGKVKAHTITLPDGKPDVNALAPYIRNSDTPWEM